jgi:multiple sugar transport system substrate-binding protein
VVGESPLCCYRADWLNDPAHQAAMRKLLGSGRTEPATWEQFAQLAEYFHEHGMGGLPPLPRADADLDRLFYQVAAGYARRALRTNEERDAAHAEDAFSFHYDVKTGQPRIASAGFVHALKWLQRVQKCRPPEPKDQDHPEKAFAAGRAVLCLTDVPWLKTFQQRPDLRDKIGLCRLPGGECSFDFATGRSHAEPDGNRVPYLGGAGWLAVVRRDSEHVETAFDLLADLSGPKTSMQIFLSAVGRGGPLRTSQLYRHRWDAFDLDAKQSQRLPEVLQDTLLHRQLKNPALCLRTPRQAEHRVVLVAGLRRALLQGADAEATLREVAEGWRKLDERQGAEKHQADYRRSLGLLAQ